MRLLVVDADPVDRRVTRDALDSSGVATHVAEVGSHADALAALAAASYDAVLVDQEVAGASAVELATRMRSGGDATAIVCLTATADESLLQVAVDAGVTDFLHDVDRAPRRLALRVQVAVRVARAEAQLARSVAARDEVLGIVSHDLRGPLHAIGLAVEALRDEVPTASQRFLGSIDRSTARAERLIRDLLEASAIENGVLELARRPVDAASIVRQATADHELLAKDSGGTITAALPTDALLVDADRERIMQVLGNLIGNALKHARGSAIEIAVERRDNAAWFAVRDRGPGITEAELPHIFDRYWRGRTKRGGAGLGLAIAKGIVTAHGGEITARSDGAGTGTEVSFTLPLAPPRAR